MIHNHPDPCLISIVDRRAITTTASNTARARAKNARDRFDSLAASRTFLITPVPLLNLGSMARNQQNEGPIAAASAVIPATRAWTAHFNLALYG